MEIAIIGGGLMGMTLAYLLSEHGQHVTVLEQGSTPGGLHNSVELDDFSIARYQHNIFPGDTHTLDLVRQLGLQDDVLFRPAHSGFLHNGEIYPIDTIRDFLTFAPLRLWDRLRLGQTIVQARLTHNWQMLDQIPAKEWLIRVGGQQNFERIWAPLLEAKFDYQYADVPATFVWSWLNRVSTLRGPVSFSPSVAHLRRGPEMLIRAMSSAITARGSEIQTGTRVREIELFGQQVGRVRTNTGIIDGDVVVAALPTPEFSRLLLSAEQRYLDSLDAIPYLGLICPAVILNRPLSEYWTLSVTDPTSPFSSIVEMPYYDDLRYHVVYLPKYTAPDNDWMGVPDATIREAWLMRLRQIDPSLKPEHIEHFVVSRSRYVDPIYMMNSARHIPAVSTPYRGLYLANTTQVYPDLPTNEAVIAHAQRVARQIMTHGERRLMAQPAA